MIEQLGAKHYRIDLILRKPTQSSRTHMPLSQTQTFHPAGSVRNLRGKNGFLIRLPRLACAKRVGCAEGTTLLVLTHKDG